MLSMKKGAYLLAAVLCLSLVFGQINETAKKRTFQGSVTINLGSYEDYYLRIVTGQPVISARPGETVSFNLFVRRGDDPAAVHDVEILDADPRFDIAVSPTVIPYVRNIDMVRVNAMLTVPEDVAPGVYPLRINVKGKEFVEAPYPLDVRVKVGPHSILPSILLIVAAGALTALLIWRKRLLHRNR
jgi:uncharacterized membrane protein